MKDNIRVGVSYFKKACGAARVLQITDRPTRMFCDIMHLIYSPEKVTVRRKLNPNYRDLDVVLAVA